MSCSDALWVPHSFNELCAGASETAGNQGEGEGENSVLPETEGGAEGRQGQISRKGAVTFFLGKISIFVFLNGFSSKYNQGKCEGFKGRCQQINFLLFYIFLGKKNLFFHSLFKTIFHSSCQKNVRTKYGKMRLSSPANNFFGTFDLFFCHFNYRIFFMRIVCRYLLYFLI